MNRFQILKMNTDGPPCSEHTWVTDGGRDCPMGHEDCSQSVYHCLICDVYDYGDPGGPGWEDCKKCINMAAKKLIDHLNS